MAHHAHVLTAHELLQAVTLVTAGDLTRLHIGQQREGKLVLADEFGVGRGVVLADAQHLDAVLFKAIPAITEIAGFFGAARGVVFGIEVDDDPLSSQRRQLYKVAVLIGEREIGCRIADLESHWSRRCLGAEA